MELLDRYLKAVKFWLPNEQKQDIIAELSEDIRSQIEDKESELGRPLNHAELDAILKKLGPPMLVAQRYLPPRYLIGPALFPMYWFVLRLGWLCIYGPWLIIVIGLKIFASFGAAHAGAAATGMFEPFFRSLFIQFAVITGVFVVIERTHAKAPWLQNWNPRKQLKLRDPNQVPRTSSISELAWYVMLLLWWVNVLRLPAIPGVNITMAPAFLRLYWPILVLIVCQGIIDCVNAFRPQWNPRRAALRGIVDGLSFLVVGYFLLIWLQGGTLVAVTGAKLSNAEIAAAQKGITYGWSVVLLIWAAASYAARTVQDARRAASKPPIRNWALRLLVGD
jgi:hypothetical protein